MYQLLQLLNGVLLMGAGRVLLMAPRIDRLRYIGAWMMLAVGVRHLYVALRLHQLYAQHRPTPPIPPLGWATEVLVFAGCCAFHGTWIAQQAARRRAHE